MTKEAVLIVDAQVFMFAPYENVFDGVAKRVQLTKLADYARTNKMPLIFVRHAGAKGYPDEAGSATWQIIPELAPRPDELIIDKNKVDAFGTTDIEKKLRAEGITDLIVAGFQTEFCIQTNARNATERGFQVRVVGDAHSTIDSDSETAEQIIERVNRELAPNVKVVSLNDVLTR